MLKRRIALALLTIMLSLSVAKPVLAQYPGGCPYPGYNLVAVHIVWLWLIYDVRIEELYAEENDPCQELGIAGYVSSCQIEFLAYCDACYGCN